MNYFEFFDIPISFMVDEGDLKIKFYRNSRKYHPDFYTLEVPQKQQEILQLSSLNNEAYRTLSDFDKRMQYILQEKGLLVEGEGKLALPQDFLMDMMDINEKLMELESDGNEYQLSIVETEVTQILHQLETEIQGSLKAYKDPPDNPEILQNILIFYYKKKYLLRIQESLSKFADRK